MKIKITSNADKVLKRNKKRVQSIRNQIGKEMREFADDMRDRAMFYAGEISGPYSVGTKSGKLRSSIRRTPVARNGNSWSVGISQATGIAPYGPLQEAGVDASKFSGWRPIPGHGMAKVIKPPFHRGFKGKHFMAKTVRDAKREFPRYIRKGVITGIRSV